MLNAEGQVYMLFDVQSDPQETANLAGDPSVRAVEDALRLRVLERLLQTQLRGSGYAFDVHGPMEPRPASADPRRGALSGLQIQLFQHFRIDYVTRNAALEYVYDGLGGPDRHALSRRVCLGSRVGQC